MSFLGFYGTNEVSILRNALRIDLDDVLASIMKLSSLIPTRLEILKKSHYYLTNVPTEP